MISKMKLKDVGIIVTGNTPSKKNKDYYDSNDINFFTPTDFEDGRINDFEESVNYISNNAKEKARILPKGSVLVTCIGIIGKVGIVEKESAFNQQINAIIPNKDIIDNRYLAYWLISKADYLRKKANAPVVPIINKTDFQELEIVVPDMETQKEIVNKLNKMQKLIDLKEEQKCLFEDLIKSQFVEMFGDLEINNKKWKIVNILEVASIDTNMTKDFEKYAELPHIGIENIEKNTGKLINYISVEKSNLTSGKYIFDERHIIYSKIRPNLNKVATPDFKGLCSADSYPILTNEKCKKEYLVFVLRSDYFLNYILSYSSRTNIPKVNKEQLSGFDFPLPPIELQNQFADFVKQIDKQKFEIQKNLEEMKKTKENLMNKYFN
ncbi:MAG: restriction endonuclease subunit S [Clostridia bacterium]|jgi:type I restriction enzyme S subunit|nr:restriction endonuclease subunit S [Clostridia bacterium]